jgi:hypothetical protein
MAVAGMTPSDQYTVGSFEQGFHDIDGIDRAAAHQTYDSDIDGILDSRRAG